MSSQFSMKFHPGRGAAALPLPIALGHFLPWFTIRAADFPLSQARLNAMSHPATLEDYRHWRESRSGYRRSHQQMPEIGPYDSRDPKVIRWQLESARDAGVAGFIINWYGQNSAENIITLHVLDELERLNRDHANQPPFTYIFSIDSQAQMNTEGKTPATLAEDVAYIRRELMRPSYLHRDDRPVFTCFPYEENLPQWLSAFDTHFGRGHYDFLWMYGGRGEGETGCFVWVRPDDKATDHKSPYPWFDPDNSGAGFAAKMYQDWSEPRSNHQYGMGGVWPGFNDTLVAWAWKDPAKHPTTRPRIIARETEAGNTYELLWRAYLQAMGDTNRLPLPLVQIVTWNDWAETTTIEPSRDYGRRYIEMTKRFVEESRRVWAQRFGA
jgi:hypothetical protein